MKKEVLPDLIGKNLKVIFCGYAVGNESARLGCYYSGRNNRFWKTLYEVRLTGRQIRPCEYKELLNDRIGLTDLVKDQSGGDRVIKFNQKYIERLNTKIKRYNPKILAFNGKKTAKKYFKRKKIDYGKQDETVGSTKIYVLPSTSSLANRFWDIKFWQDLV